MILKSNAHTHTIFCDGQNTAEQMVLKAIDLGFIALGFSSHSECVMGAQSLNAKKTVEYKAEIARLKEKHKNEITIYTGIEQDSLSITTTEGYDYVIGSVHYVKGEDEIFHPVDFSPEDFANSVKKSFGGNVLNFAKAYYVALDEMLGRIKPDICGHFDLITKFNQDGILFDENCVEYKNMVLPIIKKYAKDVIFEINTGAISRGYRNDPYPSRFILEELFKNGAKIMINSDTHSMNTIDCHFNEALSFAQDVGFKKLFILEKNGFVEIDII